MRVRHKVNVRIGDDANLTDVLFGPDDTLAEVIADGFLRQASGKFTVDAVDSEALSFGDVTDVKGLFIKADGDLQININALGNLQARRSSTATGTEVKFFFEGDVSSVTLGNTGATAINGIYCVWGDAAP